MIDNILDLDATGQADAIARGDVSAPELLEATIARIEARDVHLHAVASRAYDAARARVRTPLHGPFAGVPFLVKDLLAYPGQPLTFGARVFASNIAQQGSPYSERIDAAGLVVLGKSTTSELGLLGSTESRLFGVTRNPHDPTRSATGSSGGAAAAVAAGLVPFAHASDGGGSIRIPASACGLFGFKPGRGRTVSNGQPALFEMISEHVVSRSVRDSARFFALTEPDGRTGFVAHPLTERLRIGVYDRTLVGEGPDAEPRRALEHTAAILRELGHEVVEATLPDFDGAALSDGFFTLAGAGIHQLSQMMEGMLGRPLGDADLEPFTLALCARFRRKPEGAIARAIADFERAGAAFRAEFAHYDLLLSPTLPIEPPPLGTLSPELDPELLIRRTERLAGYTPIHSIAGTPAMSVPLYRTAAGLPIGTLLAGPEGSDGRLFALAYQLEATPSWRSVPVVPRT